MLGALIMLPLFNNPYDTRTAEDSEFRKERSSESRARPAGLTQGPCSYLLSWQHVPNLSPRIASAFWLGIRSFRTITKDSAGKWQHMNWKKIRFPDSQLAIKL